MSAYARPFGAGPPAGGMNGFGPAPGGTESELRPVPSSHVTAQQIKNFISGIKDSFKFREVFERIKSDPRTQASMLRATMIQIILLVSVVALDFVIAPSLAKKGLDHSSAAKYWQLLWLYPLLGLSFFCAGIAHADLANSGNTHNSSQGHSSKSSNKLLDNISRALVIVQCFVVGFLLYRIPLLGRFACFVFFCVVDAYYCFEYIWVAKGLDLKERAKFLEERWPYFAGFGLPSTIISFFHPSPIVNLALFSLFFPLNLLLAQHARPPAGDMGLLGASGETTKRNPADKCARLPVLWIAVRIHDALHSASLARVLNLPTASQSSKKSATGPSGGGSTYQAPYVGGGSFMRPMPPHFQPSTGTVPPRSSAQRDAGGSGQAHGVSARGNSPFVVANAGGAARRQPRAAGKMD